MTVQYLSSARGWNTASAQALPEGKGRFMLLSNQASGYFTGVTNHPTASFNGVSMVELGFIIFNTTQYDYGHARAMGLAIPDSWAAGTYSMVDTNMGYHWYTFFSGVDYNNPYMSNRSAWNDDINAAADSLYTPSGGAHVLLGGSQNDSGVNLSATGFSTWYATQTQYIGYRFPSLAETLKPEITPATPRGVVIQFILNQTETPSSSAVWW